MKGRVVAGLVCGLYVACDPALGTAVDFAPDEVAQILSLSPLPPLPPSPTNRFADDPAAAEFGQRLFFDTRLSATGETSCATCHDPRNGFSDGRRRARGISGGKRHTPALFNLGYAEWLFWDGRADSLWAQALQPIEAAAEMGSSRVAVWRLVAEDVALRREYETVFGAMPLLDSASLPRQENN